MGSRHYPDLSRVADYVGSLPPTSSVVTGSAAGVDATAARAARERGLPVRVLGASFEEARDADVAAEPSIHAEPTPAPKSKSSYRPDSYLPPSVRVIADDPYVAIAPEPAATSPDRSTRPWAGGTWAASLRRPQPPWPTGPRFPRSPRPYPRP